MEKKSTETTNGNGETSIIDSNDSGDVDKSKPEGEVDMKFPAWHFAVAGAMSGVGSRVATAPLDLIRIRRQVMPRTAYPSESLWESWRKIVQNEGGISALFRGNVAALYLWVGYSAVQFSLYNKTREALQPHYGHYPTLTAFIAGATAGVCATLATYPFDVCRTTFATRGLEQSACTVASLPPAVHIQPPPTERPRPVPFHSLVEMSYLHRSHSSPSASSASTHPARMVAASTPVTQPPRTISDFAWQLYRQRGVAGFYAGAGPAVLQIIPYMGLNFAIYDALTAGDRRVMGSAYAGSIAGAISKLLVYPMDTVKRRLQAQAFYSSGGNTSSTLSQSIPASGEYRSMWECFQKIAETEGLSSFYRGVVPSVLKTTISTGLTFALYRLSKNALEALHLHPWSERIRDNYPYYRAPTR